MNAVPPPLPSVPPVLPRISPILQRIAGKRQEPAPALLPPLDLRLLAELPSLTLQARYLVDGFLSGRHRSPQKGSSVEFAEYRDYQLGDDLRRVDWRLYGRTDRLHVKQYEEETQLRAFLVLDTSASMDFQSRPTVMRKIEFARLVLAALGALAQRQGDAFGLGIVGTDLKDFLRARSSTPHWKTLVARLEAIRPGGQTVLSRGLNDLAEVIPPRSLVIIASDFYEEPALIQTALRRLRYDHHEVIGLHVLDPMEVDFDLDANGMFVDVEDGARLKLDSPAARKGYLERFNKFRDELDDLFRNAGGELTPLRTDEAPMAALSRYLAAREERIQ